MLAPHRSRDGRRALAVLDPRLRRLEHARALLGRPEDHRAGAEDAGGDRSLERRRVGGERHARRDVARHRARARRSPRAAGRGRSAGRRSARRPVSSRWKYSVKPTRPIRSPARSRPRTSMRSAIGPADARDGLACLADLHLSMHAVLAVRTYVRVAGDDPARRPRRLLRVGRAARRPRAARAPGDRRRLGVVLAASYEAKARGVRTAMGAAGARAGCARHAVVVPPRMSAYSEASKAVFAVFDDTSPLVEGLSIDEAFLDVARDGAQCRHADRDRRAAASTTCASRSACR